MICAGSIAANNGACPAAQGAGLVWNNQLAGVLIGAFGCGAANNPPIFAQVNETAMKKILCKINTIYNLKFTNPLYATS